MHDGEESLHCVQNNLVILFSLSHITNIKNVTERAAMILQNFN